VLRGAAHDPDTLPEIDKLRGDQTGLFGKTELARKRGKPAFTMDKAA
jgi:hypothetical protein